MPDIFTGIVFMDVHGDVAENLENLKLSWNSVFLIELLVTFPKSFDTHTHKCIDTAQVKAIHTFQLVVLWS